MGIRIHKMLGYGLTDLVDQDERLNWESPFLEYELCGEGALERYFDWLADYDRSDVAKSLMRDPHRKHGYRDFDIQGCFTMGTVDGGLENVLCLRPLAWTDWYRYDDTIDYAEQTYLGEQHDEARVIKYALYPHDSYMDARTGERIKSGSVDIYFWLRARNEGSADVTTLDELARLGGFESHADAEAHCVPLVPDEVRWLAEFGDLFTDPATVLTLRPMIYTWWA